MQTIVIFCEALRIVRLYKCLVRVKIIPDMHIYFLLNIVSLSLSLCCFILGSLVVVFVSLSKDSPFEPYKYIKIFVIQDCVCRHSESNYPMIYQ